MSGLTADVQRAFLAMNSTQRDAGPCSSDFGAYFVYRDVERYAQNQLRDWPLQAEEYIVCEWSVFRCELGASLLDTIKT